MKIVDISLTLSQDMIMYPGCSLPKFFTIDTPDDEQSFLTTKIEIETHTGTHIDAPKHLLGKGLSVDKIPLDNLYGTAIIYEAKEERPMGLSAFKKEITDSLKDKIVIFKTGEGKYLAEGTFRRNFLVPSKELSMYLIDQGIKCVGIDTLSIDACDPFEVVNHPLYLENDIPVIEGLYLEDVLAGQYTFICLPLKLKNLDGSPARAIIIQND